MVLEIGTITIPLSANWQRPEFAETVEQHLLGKGQARGSAGADFINVRRAGGENFVPGTHPRIEPASEREAKEKESAQADPQPA